jgi:uncharacterized protein (TIGR02117 family)
MFKKIIGWVFYTIFSIIGILVLYLFLAFFLPLIKHNKTFTETPDGVTIYVCSNGVHTDIAMPIKTDQLDWRSIFPVKSFKAVDSTFKYIEIGWGDKGFYLYTPTWADLKFKTAFKAIFFLDSAAMHVTYDRYVPDPSPKACHKINISTAQYQQLITYITASFDMHNGKPAVFPGKGYDLNDNFYEAKGHYSFLKTCNVWTSEGLSAAGIEQGLWSPFEGGVMSGYSDVE